jgi:Mn-containing catalase
MARTFPDETTRRLVALCVEYLRAPAGSATDDTTGDPILDFDPPLTAEEQVTYEILLGLTRSETVRQTPAEFAVVREQLQVLRALRQLGRNAYMGLSAAERDRMMYDAMVAVTIILIGEFRETLAAAART